MNWLEVLNVKTPHHLMGQIMKTRIVQAAGADARRQNAEGRRQRGEGRRHSEPLPPCGIGCYKVVERSWLVASIGLWLLAIAPAPAAEQMTRLDARSGSKMRLEGTSTLHDWQAESPIITGYIEVGPNFPMAPGQPATPGKVEAHGEATIMVRSLRSVESDGK